jgi:hypothetical protein
MEYWLMNLFGSFHYHSNSTMFNSFILLFRNQNWNEQKNSVVRGGLSYLRYMTIWLWAWCMLNSIKSPKKKGNYVPI